MSNPRSDEVTDAFIVAVEQWRRLVHDRDTRAFEQHFNEVRDFFGPLTAQALEQSSFLIDRLVERS
jgi:chorismate mutase/prephenate dehydrogenase